MIETLNGTREIVNFKAQSALKLYDNNKKEDYPLHWHAEIEIIMPVQNTYTCVCANEKVVLDEQDILILCPGCIHALYHPHDGEGRRIIFQPSTSQLLFMNDLESLFTSISPYLVIRKKENSLIHKKIVDLLLEITDIYEKSEDYYELEIYSKTLELFGIIGKNQSLLVEEGGTQKFPTHNEYIDKFNSVCRYLDEHCAEDIKLDDIASMSGFSKFYFSRLFKEFSGETFYKYVNIRRITKAEKLLVSPGFSVTDVALNCGYSSLPSFIRMFKTIKGCTPTEFKNMYWKR